MAVNKKIKVLIVDDSALVRKILKTGLEKDPEIEVIGLASNPYEARDLLIQNKPDVITLDVEMPKMDGVTFLRKFMPKFPIPTVVISSLTEAGKKITIQAMEAGAVDIITKPKVGVADGMPLMMPELCERVKAASKIDVSRRAKTMSNIQKLAPVEINCSLDQSTDLVIAIGASTGGVEALARILPAFPANTPGIVIVQHMPIGFTNSFAQRLNGLCKMQVKEAQHNDRIRPGMILIAPGGEMLMKVQRSGGQYITQIIEGEKVSRHRPSVDVLFESVAKFVGKNAIAVLMTGMGSDGAEGLKKINDAGGITYTQDEASCVVYGMPKIAWNMQAAKKQLSLETIPKEVMLAVSKLNIT